MIASFDSDRLVVGELEGVLSQVDQYLLEPDLVAVDKLRELDEAIYLV